MLLQDSRIIPVIFHNLSKYDGHYLIKEVSKGFSGNLSVLPITKENYISFSVYTENHFRRNEGKKHKKIIQFRFLDSLRFLNASLDKLASSLNNYAFIENFFPDTPPEKLELLLRKGVFPYDCFDSPEKLNITKLPAKRSFLQYLKWF